MLLTNKTQVHLNGCRHIVTVQSLAGFHLKHQESKLPSLWDDHTKYQDIDALQYLLLYNLPFSVEPQKSDDFFFLAGTIKRFPYKVNSQGDYAAFSLRLMPLFGYIKGIISTKPVLLNRIWDSTGAYLVDFAQIPLHLEIIRFKDAKHTALGPPVDYQKNVYTNESFID